MTPHTAQFSGAAQCLWNALRRLKLCVGPNSRQQRGHDKNW